MGYACAPARCKIILDLSKSIISLRCVTDAQYIPFEARACHSAGRPVEEQSESISRGASEKKVTGQDGRITAPEQY